MCLQYFFNATRYLKIHFMQIFQATREGSGVGRILRFEVKETVVMLHAGMEQMKRAFRDWSEEPTFLLAFF